MNLIPVYRYENESGEGPYRVDSDFSYDLGWNHNRDNYHPGWRQDFEEQHKSEFVAGCDSIVSLNDWFSEFKLDLHKEGFRVKKYVVPREFIEYGKSGKQLRFKK